MSEEIKIEVGVEYENKYETIEITDVDGIHVTYTYGDGETVDGEMTTIKGRFEMMIMAEDFEEVREETPREDRTLRTRRTRSTTANRQMIGSPFEENPDSVMEGRGPRGW